MYTRRLLRSFSARSAFSAVLSLLAACHSQPGGPVLPTPAKDQVQVGYGSQDRRNVNGATASADADKLMANSPRTVSDMLVGRFSGVEVRKLANGGTSIRIRGSRSFKSNQEPLLVLDGTPQHNGTQSLMDLDPPTSSPSRC